MNTNARLALSLAAAALMLATPAFADDPARDGSIAFSETQVTACAPTLHADASPDSRVVGRVALGDRVTVLQARRGWAEVGRDDGSMAWLRLSDTAGLNADVRPLRPREDAWLTSSTHVHEWPRQSAPVEGRLAEGQRVYVLAECEGWVRVRGGGMEGWIPERLLSYSAPNVAVVTPAPPPPPPPPRQRLRAVVAMADPCMVVDDPSAVDARWWQCRNQFYSFSERYGVVGGPDDADY